MFDMDDTLIPTSAIDRAAILTAAASAAAAASPDAVAQRFAGLLKDEPFPAAGSGVSVATWRTGLWARALAPDGSGVPADADAARSAHDLWVSERLGNFRFDEPVRALVRRIQAAGYVTGILTNGHVDVQRAKVEACAAGTLFDRGTVILAAEHPEEKPAASVFRVACAALGQPAESTIMVGDSYKADIAGAHNAELLASVWVRPPPDGSGGGSLMHGHLTDVPPGQRPPSFTIGSVLELEAVLEQIG